MTDASSPEGAQADKRLKIGLVVDSSDVSTYIRDLAQWGISRDDLVFSHLIMQDIRADARSRIGRIVKALRRYGPWVFASLLGFMILSALERRMLRRSQRHKDHLESRDIGALVPETVLVTPQVSASGLVHTFSPGDVDKIRSLKLDVLVRCGSGILRGDILSAAKFGILSFHHGDNRINRGGPAGFWEVYQKSAQTGFVIQRLTEELDGGDVLCAGCFPTQSFYLLNQAFLYKKSNYYLKKLLVEIARLGNLPSPRPEVPYSNPLFRVPRLHQQLRYGVYLLGVVGGKVLRRLRGNQEFRWNIAFSRRNWRDTVMWRATGVPNPKGHFLADPFILREQGRDYCFVEDYDVSCGKGSIAVYEFVGAEAKRLGDAVEEDFHMSFPFLFRYESKLYMCPESSGNRDIRVYECVDFPLKWRHASTLMSDVSAADTMLFPYRDRWWMLTNIDPSGCDDHCSELSVFHADSPLSDAWWPHPGNPVIVDAACARNGGLIRDETGIFRVSQKQGFGVYGAGFRINKITDLDFETYEEREIAEVEPHFLAGAVGTHHMTSNGYVTVFDFETRSPSARLCR